MNISKFIITFFGYCFLFILLKYEQVYLGPFKLSILWKTPLLFYSLYICIKYFSKSRFFWVSILLSINIFFNFKILYGFKETLIESIYILTLPLTFFTFLHIYGKNKIKQVHLLKFILNLASFFIFSSLPFLLGILQQERIIDVIEADTITGNVLTGIFYHMSISSQIFAVSTIIILFNREYYFRKNNKLLWYAVLFCGFYATYAAYTRMGWLLLGIGVVYYLKNKIKFYHLIAISLIGVLVIFSSDSVSIGEDSAIYKRLIGESKHTTNKDLDLNTLTSGRMNIILTSLENVVDEGGVSFFIGIGKDYSTYMTSVKMGAPYVAHNRFVEIFCYGGIFALLLFFIYIFHLRKIVKSINTRNSQKKLVSALFLLLIITYFPSHGFNLFSDFLFGGILAYAKLSDDDLSFKLFSK